MLKIPTPSSQARLLSLAIMERFGHEVPHQDALELIAQMNGFKTWNNMRSETAKARAQAKAEARAEAKALALLRAKRAVAKRSVLDDKAELLSRMVAVAASIVQAAKGRGTDDGSPLADSGAIEQLSKLTAEFDALMLTPLQPLASDVTPQKPAPSRINPELKVAGFGVGDVQSVRPDLSDEEALAVLRHCDSYLDASVGLNWDRLEDWSYRVFPARAAVGDVILQSEKIEGCTLNLATGTIYVTSPAGLREAGATQGTLRRHELLLRSTLGVSRMGKSLGDAPVFRVSGANGFIDVNIENGAAFGGESEELRQLRPLMAERQAQPHELPLGMPR